MFITRFTNHYICIHQYVMEDYQLTCLPIPEIFWLRLGQNVLLIKNKHSLWNTFRSFSSCYILFRQTEKTDCFSAQTVTCNDLGSDLSCCGQSQSNETETTVWCSVQLVKQVATMKLSCIFLPSAGCLLSFRNIPWLWNYCQCTLFIKPLLKAKEKCLPRSSSGQLWKICRLNSILF